ncbi:related to 1-aminocyclopropane-1-carboxylate synthase, and related proteins [Cephalotrichum gorgonifer]|uniref:Related to 1-aminocyclopropane-1-carboxylate synthase, and related proteins n=1 Tax=Cephalotrichum gorgonifer TaxID=2041049 RepID=A0AAE8SXY3_9PEZI|nr:related to 1-aminocyclopropane-1-carboxylate synthase, and related proteins [Cephalotrichum gorgonifer]
MGNPWSPDNPDGTIILRLAENSLMHNELKDFVEDKVNVLPTNHLTYSTGPRGSHRLRRAAAAFWTREFQPRENITLDNIFITPGLASAIDALTWSICDEGDGILIPLPLYNGFNVDIMNRSNVRVIGVPRAIEAALRKAENDGIVVRALLVSHPHNPLGRCYPPETMKEFASICGENGLHFISDEIYAKSVFNNPAVLDAAPFVSALALDLRNAIDKTFVMSSIAQARTSAPMAYVSGFIFSWSPHVLQDVWAAIFEDEKWLSDFMAKKINLMEEQYSIATSFFREHGIRYYEMTAGLYIWVDLRHFLLPHSPSQEIDFGALKVTAPDAAIYKQREMMIADICIKNGVMIAPGHVYMPEEYGWFQVTFTVGREALQEGLRRIGKSLEEVKVESQKW